MKKTLIALSALSLSAGAMAQVTVSGNLGFSHSKAQALPTTQSALNAGTIGMRMTDGEVAFTAVEDLGGGYKATANSAVLLRGRDTAVSARNATIALLTPVGQVTVGTGNTESGAPRAWAGAKIALPSDAAGDNFDVFAFTTLLGPLVTTLSYTESGTSDVNALADAFGAALTGNAAGNKVEGGAGGGGGPIQVTSLGADYSSGPLSIGGSVGVYSTSLGAMQDKAAVGIFKSGYEGRTDTSISVAYDLGMAKVGLGYTARTKGWANETKAGIAAPMGALTLSMTYEHKGDDTATLGSGVKAGDFTGFTLAAAGANLTVGDLKGTAERTKIRFGVDYAFSKSTSLNVSYGVFRLGSAARTGSSVGGTALTQPNNVETSEYQIRLLKAF